MMPTPDRSPLKLKFPAGTDNQSREFEIPDGAARRIINMDVTRAGAVRVRDGLRRLSSTPCHSLFPRASGALLVSGGQLCRMAADYSLTPLVPVVGRVSYADHNAEIFWSDGASVGRITTAGQASFWGLTAPAAQITTTAGAWPAGLYRIALTARVYGVESGASAVTLPIADGQAVTVTTPAAANEVDFIVYATARDGTELRQVAILPPNATGIPALRDWGKPLLSLHATAPPAGRYVRAYSGRLWIAAEKTLWFTASLSPHWIFPADHFVQFERPITLLDAVADGLYVSTDQRVYFLQGAAPAQMHQRVVSPFGAVPGTGNHQGPRETLAGDAAPDQMVYWVDQDGAVCVGRSGGIIERVTAARFRAPGASLGHSAYREHQGIRQLIIALAGASTAADDTPIRGQP